MVGCYSHDEGVVFLNANQKTPSRMLSHLSHELVHVEQFHLGWAKNHPTDFKLITWFGKEFDLSLLWEMTDDQYLSLPWERDAFRREKSVLKTIKKHLAVAHDDKVG